MLNIGILSHFSFPKTLFPSFLHHLCLQFLYPTNFLVRECFSLLVLPRGSIGREIINHNHLAEEIICLSRQTAPSERVIVFLAVMMQRYKMVKKGADIRRLLKRRMDEWRQERFPELIHEYERCAKQWSKSHVVNLDRSKDHVLRVFSNQ